MRSAKKILNVEQGISIFERQRPVFPSSFNIPCSIFEISFTCHSLERWEETLVFESFCKEKLAPLALRMALGSFCVYHGYLKIMAAGGTAWYPGLPTGWQLLISWGEFCAGMAILLGFRCRWAAGTILALTTGTLIWWQGWNVFRLPLRSLEPTLMLVLSALALLFLGAGGFSFDGRGGGRATAARAIKKG
jgi:uncharacterized membrane protein YphA (DoxX/SURF4 family)